MSVRRLAERVRQVARQEADRHYPGPRYFKVVRHHPLRLESQDSDGRIDIGDPDVTSLARSRQLDEGDVVPVLQDRHGDYVVMGGRKGGTPVSRSGNGPPDNNDRDNGDFYVQLDSDPPNTLWVKVGDAWFEVAAARARRAQALDE